MKKVIEGKTYNTATATELATWSNGLFPRDFGYDDQTLYKSSKGQFFLYGEGGPMSQWSESNGNETSGSCDIRLLSEDDAREWMETHANADEYSEVFGEIEG